MDAGADDGAILEVRTRVGPDADVLEGWPIAIVEGGSDADIEVLRLVDWYSGTECGDCMLVWLENGIMERGKDGPWPEPEPYEACDWFEECRLY